jgi:general secretion pathway protein K
MSRARQAGVAIVLALGVVALAAVAAAAMLASQSTWSRHAELGAEHTQAQVLAQAGIDWARAVLADDRRAGSVDHLGEPWALRLAPLPVENGELAGEIDDQQAAFNLNNLAGNGGAPSPVHLAQFRRLLTILDLPPALAASLPPYLPLLEAAELARVPGFDAAVRDRLRPFVTALPRLTPVNANTAPPEVLAAVIEGLDLDAARALVEQRARVWFRTRAELLAQLPASAVAPASEIALGSDFFQASARVTIGDAQARASALLIREQAAWPVVVWRKFP